MEFSPQPTSVGSCFVCSALLIVFDQKIFKKTEDKTDPTNLDIAMPRTPKLVLRVSGIPMQNITKKMLNKPTYIGTLVINNPLRLPISKSLIASEKIIAE